MIIRAHHLLCMKYFKGKGYSPNFVSNFKDIIKKLQDNPKIKVTDHPDIVCSACPHNIDQKCIKKPDSEEKVRKKDNTIMKILNIRPNQEIKAKDAETLVNEKLKELKQTCKDCEWKEYCN